MDRAAIAGNVSVSNSTGALTNSFADDNIGGTPSGSLSGGSGSLGTTVSSTTGRGTGSYTIQDGPFEDVVGVNGSKTGAFPFSGTGN